MTFSSSSFLLLAPPGGGKTHFCRSKISETLAQAPFAPFWLIVRDRLQAAAYRQQLRQAGLALGVTVATFGDLYAEVLEQGGSGLPMAEEPALRVLVRAVIDDLYAQGGLEHFARIREMPGFVAALRERFAELKSALVLPEQLMEAAQVRQDAALVEVARLYAAYQQRLSLLGWADREGVSWLGLEALRAHPRMLQDVRLVMVDGFDSFNPAQRETLRALAGRVQELWITLPGSEEMLQVGPARAAFRRFAKACQDLLAHIPLQVVSLPPEANEAGNAAALEFRQLADRLFETPREPLLPGEHITLLEAQSPDEEAREALRWLKARMVRDGTLPGACALIVPDFATYRAAILAAGAEFGLALRLTQPGSLADTPPFAALLDLLYLPLHNYPLRLLLDTIRAPFFDFSADGLHREDAKRLEIVSRYGQIFEGLSPWREVLGELAQVGEPARPQTEESDQTQVSIAGEEVPREVVEEEEEEAAVPALPKGAAADKLLGGLESLAGRVTPAAGGQPVGEWIRWLVDLLASIRFAENLTTAEEQRWLETFRRLLGALARSDRLAAGSGSAASRPGSADSRAYAAFVSEMQSLLAATPAVNGADAVDAAGQESPAGQALLVLHPYDARGLRFRAVALVGLAESVFPSVERADPFLPEAVRAELDMDLRLGQDQASIFYQMATRAEAQMLFTRHYLAEDGESWDPSPFWSALQEVLGPRAVRVRPEDRRPLRDAASAEELLLWAARRAALAGGGLEASFPEREADHFQRRFQAVQRAQQVLAARANESGQQTGAGPQSGARMVLSSGRLEGLHPRLLERFGAQAVWSASRLESYATCPFFFFAASALGLELIRAPKAGFEAVQLGSLLHEALEQVYRDCPQPGEVDALLALLPEVAARVFADAPRKYAFRPTLLWQVQQAELLETLRATVLGLAALDAAAGWQPEDFERRFGIEGAPFLEIAVDGQPVRLRGVIDRIDRDRDGRLRVIDYKSGGAHLAAQDLLEGRRLQLPLYALAAEQALGLGRVAEGLYWKLFAQEPGALRLARFQCDLGDGPRAAYELAVQHVQRLVSGIRGGAFAPQSPAGGCPSYCPASSWCWSYRPRTGF